MKSPSNHSLHQSLKLRGHAARMREQPTPTEHLLWQALRGCQLGLWFRRQVVVAGCIVDFLAPAARLVVEVDGGYHTATARRRADARRDRKLGRLGLTVLRLPAQLILTNLPAAVRRVWHALGTPPS